jgi:predicted RNA-binding Zn-ribbon protein involved in translation (DUF1610 family)
VELEENSLEKLPENCQSCGTALTEKEKATALEEGASVVLCTTCAAEASALPAEDAEDFES